MTTPSHARMSCSSSDRLAILPIFRILGVLPGRSFAAGMTIVQGAKIVMSCAPPDVTRHWSCCVRLRPTRAGGCVFAEDPNLGAAEARLFWRPHIDPRVIIAEAIPAQDDRDTFDLFAQRVPAILLEQEGQPEELLLNPGPHAIRMSVTRGTLLGGPVNLTYRLQGLDMLGAQLLALRRLETLHRTGCIPVSLFPAARRISRWTRVLETLDALASSPTQRAVAVRLYGTPAVLDGWSATSDSMQSRVRRLIAEARRLAKGGFLDLVRSG